VPALSRWSASLALAAAALIPGCGPPRPREIAWGDERCAHCHMNLVDPRFAAQLRTGTGKSVVFDDVGCLAEWIRENRAPVGAAWVASFTEPRDWLATDRALYLLSDTLRTPMASGLAALRAGREADSVLAALGGRLLTWPEVLAMPHRHAPSAPT
jgi:copper chaperone NosL